MPRAAPGTAPVPVEAPARWMMIGSEVGRLAGEFLVEDMEAFVGLLRVPGHPLRNFLWMVMGMRMTRTNVRRTAVEAELRSPMPAVWARRLFKLAYGMYCSVRQEAVPSAGQPEAFDESTLPGGAMGRSLRRELRRTGGPAVAAEDWRTLSERSAEAMRTTWELMEDVHSVLWVDNFYRRHAGHQAMDAGVELNCTVAAVLQTSRLPPFPGFADL